MEHLSLQSGIENKSVDDMGSLCLSDIDDELEKIKVNQEQLNTQWMAEMGAVEGMNEIQDKIGKVTLEIEKCECKETGMTIGEGDGVEIEGFAWILYDEIVVDNIAHVVAVWTGIPSQKMLESKSDS
eukprot:5485967-Ditylum_brightwellii.AAC.1